MTHDDGAAGAELDDLDGMQTVIAAAHAEVNALCNGKRWQMRIPAEPLSDSDLVIAAALQIADELVVRLRSALRAPQEQAMSDYGKHWNMGSVPYWGEHGRSQDRGTASGEERSRADKGSPRHADHGDGAVREQPDQAGRGATTDEATRTAAVALTPARLREPEAPTQSVLTQLIEKWRQEGADIIAVTSRHPDPAASCILACANELEMVIQQQVALSSADVRAPQPQEDDERRCAVCGWTLATSHELGCVRGSCSQRPFPDRFYAPERAANEYGQDLTRFDKAAASLPDTPQDKTP